MNNILTFAIQIIYFLEKEYSQGYKYTNRFLYYMIFFFQ